MAALLLRSVKMDEIKKQQVEMHTNFFDRCESAIQNQFYFEAILLEYAAMESRLEAILGILGAPCNEYLKPEQRAKINISQRIECLKKARVNSHIFEKTKLPMDFFFKKSELCKWIDARNRYIHGLYKGELKYSSRMADAKAVAENGLKLCRMLYNEAKRLNRLRKSKPELFAQLHLCDSICVAYIK